jgi:hypothetical protein
LPEHEADGVTADVVGALDPEKLDAPEPGLGVVGHRCPPASSVAGGAGKAKGSVAQAGVRASSRRPGARGDVMNFGCVCPKVSLETNVRALGDNLGPALVNRKIRWLA